MIRGVNRWLNEEHNKSLKPVVLATLLILIAEMAYLVVWGMILYPQGSLPGKVMWTVTCTIAMGSVIGVFTQILVPGDGSGLARMAVAAAVMAAVGIYCTYLCARIDVHFNYFGGADNAALFLLGGVAPAIFGGIIYGWLLYRPSRSGVAG